jgi:hypothetical protein
MGSRPVQGSKVGTVGIGLIAASIVAAVAVGGGSSDNGTRAVPVIGSSEVYEPPRDVYDPVAAGEPVPAGFRQLLARDVIAPIYNPAFRAAADTDWPDDADVIGVARHGEAKAYPVSHLNRHELVSDEIDGWPILVSW